MKKCECGRPARALPRRGHRCPNRRARRRQPRYLPGHDLCEQCWQRLWRSQAKGGGT